MTFIGRLSVAPMMDWTDRHYRYFARLISRHALLYTEMVTTGAIIHGDAARLLNSEGVQGPVALQLGGSDPDQLAQCAVLGEQYGYAEINLNVGCPSDRVQSGRFGACLMAEPDLVADCVRAMKSAVRIPITVKTRMGIDANDNDEFRHRFLDAVIDAGVDALIIHARIAVLGGLSPKENRDVPPLQYDKVYALKVRYANIPMSINGGITTLEQATEHLTHMDGVMIGRAAYQTPWILAAADQTLFADASSQKDVFEVVEQYQHYIEQQLSEGWRLSAFTRHILGLFHGRPGAKRWRQILSQRSHLPDAGLNVIDDALAAVK